MLLAKALLLLPVLLLFAACSETGQEKKAEKPTIGSSSQALSSEKPGMVHTWVALQALNIMGPHIPELLDYQGIDRPEVEEPDTQGFKDGEGILDGAGEEDQENSAQYNCVDQLGITGLPIEDLSEYIRKPWCLHFWDPDNPQGGEYGDGLGLYRSNYQRAKMLFNEALDDYISNRKNRAYFNLGRVAHLLTDAATPAHVHNDAHLNDVLGAIVHSWSKDNYETYSRDISVYQSVFVDGGNLHVAEDRVVNDIYQLVQDMPLPVPIPSIPPQDYEPLFNLFWVTAQKAQYFASHDANGNSNYKTISGTALPLGGMTPDYTLWHEEIGWGLIDKTELESCDGNYQSVCNPYEPLIFYNDCLQDERDEYINSRLPLMTRALLPVAIVAVAKLYEIFFAKIAEGNFPDIPWDSWYFQYAYRLKMLNIIKGDDESGLFNGSQNVNRAEFIAMVIRARQQAFLLPGFTGTLDQSLVNPYSDVPENEWYYEPVMLAYQNGIIEGNSSFRPGDALQRDEASKITVNAFDMPVIAERPIEPFPDVPEGAWYTDYVYTLVKKKIIQGYPNKTFGPANSLNRAEAAKIVDLAFEDAKIREAKYILMGGGL
ncbi:MAG: S-layer homology domain-containing protein [Deltaproteobacteria bacterium]|nr:S-layer homology domain-containing protein [Deltaproteobacteria bacterium]